MTTNVNAMPEDRVNVIARRAMPDVATLRLSREQNQARLNYAEAEQGRPKVNL